MNRRSLLAFFGIGTVAGATASSAAASSRLVSIKQTKPPAHPHHYHVIDIRKFYWNTYKDAYRVSRQSLPRIGVTILSVENVASDGVLGLPTHYAVTDKQLAWIDEIDRYSDARLYPRTYEQMKLMREISARAPV